MDVAIPECIPRNVSESVQQHLQARRALIAHEKQARSDDAFRRSLSPRAVKACEVVARIRREEQATIWRKHKNVSDDGDFELYPGMMFSLAKGWMEKTRLWRIAKRMPKGALLHSHMSAMVDLEFLFNTTLETPGMYFYSAEPLTSEAARRTASVLFQFSKSAPPQSSTASIWSSDYVPNTLIPAKVAADTFPHGGRAGFLAWLKDRSSIVEKESLEHHLGVDEVWRKLNSAFLIIASTLYYEPILRPFIRRLLEVLVEDGVRWVELREAFPVPYRQENAETCDKDFNNMIRVIGEEIEKFKASEKGKNFWGARIIWTALRARGAEVILQSMHDCITAKKAYPHLVAGYDLVGQEDMGETLKNLSPLLVYFRQRCNEEGLEIPFFFHAGECLGDGDSTDENLFDAILFGTRRIGHAFSLYKHPKLIDMVKERKILIETCPISNEVLRLTTTVLAHPLPALLARGVAASLSNDDPALLGQGTSGMTHDFWEALQAWENLGLAGLGSLAENSVRWAVYEDQTEEEWIRDIEAGVEGTGIRAQRMKEWKESWEEFCQWVIDEFGP
ncbi:hypothetical protein VTO42DRAFT_3398 [Malbranchea cinnamomea]